MKHFFLKFNHGVEIGANLAYLGHYRRTRDPRVLEIAIEEEAHKELLNEILDIYGEKSSRVIDFIFTCIGNTVGFFCRFSPIFMLDFVARTMETFAIFNYAYLSTLYPNFENLLIQMARAEMDHEAYFTKDVA